MKICTKCKQSKELEAFARNKNKSDGKQSHCRLCKKEVDRAYQKSGKAAQVRRVGRYKEENARFVFKYLQEHSCIDCPEKDPVVLEFDHVTGKKLKSISVMVLQGFSWKHIQEEIKKCVVRCANCHRRKTAKERGTFRWLEQENNKPL